MSISFEPFRRDGLTLRLARGPGVGTVGFLQHGLCGDAGQTMEVIPHDVVSAATLECRGHGGSEAGDPAALTIARFAEDVAAAMEPGELPLFVGGISMGAAIALRLAVTRPDLVRALVLARPAWVTAAGPENLEPNIEVGRRLAKPRIEGEGEMFRQSPIGRCLAQTAPDNLASLLGFFEREPRAVTSELLTRISSDGPGVGPDDLGRLDIPCLVVGTAEDAIHPLAHARTLAAAIPGARLVEITPKGRDRRAHVAEFQAALRIFTKDITNG